MFHPYTNAHYVRSLIQGKGMAGTAPMWFVGLLVASVSMLVGNKYVAHHYTQVNLMIMFQVSDWRSRSGCRAGTGNERRPGSEEREAAATATRVRPTPPASSTSFVHHVYSHATRTPSRHYPLERRGHHCPPRRDLHRPLLDEASQQGPVRQDGHPRPPQLTAAAHIPQVAALRSHRHHGRLPEHQHIGYRDHRGTYVALSHTGSI